MDGHLLNLYMDITLLTIGLVILFPEVSGRCRSTYTMADPVLRRHRKTASGVWWRTLNAQNKHATWTSLDSNTDA